MSAQCRDEETTNRVLSRQDKAFDAQEAAASLRAQLEEARLEAGAGSLDHTNSASFQRVRCGPDCCV